MRRKAYAHDLAEPLAALIVALAPSHDAFVAPVTSRVKNVMPRVAVLLDVMQVLVARKRSFLAHGLGLDAYWLPVPRQEFVEAAGGMTVGHTLQDVSKPGKGLDVVELCGGDEGADGCPSDAATVRAREQMVFASERNRPVILPISGRRLKSFTVGIRCIGAVFDCNTASSVSPAGLFTSRRHPAWSLRWPPGCWIRLRVPA